MVDLVKIRRKAKEKKDAEAEVEAVRADSAPPGVPAEAARVDESPLDGSGASGAPATSAAAKESAPAKPPSHGEAEIADSGKIAKPAPDAAKKSAGGKATKAVKPVQASEPEPEPAAEVLPEPSPASPDETDDATIDRLERFKREAGKRRSWAADAAKAGAVAAADDTARDLELLRFRLAGEEYAVDIEKIVEIVPPRGTTRVPNADSSIVGIMSLRGTIVTVFDLRRKLGHPPLESGKSGDDRRMIVVEREGETAGFLVDKVSRVVKLDPVELESHPVVSAAEQSDYVGGVFQAQDGLVILLDLEKILAGQT